MKTVKALYARLNTANDFKEKYPNFDPDDGKIHVLFLSACSNESSYYRLILPALELNRTDTHAAIVSDIHKWDFNKQFDDYDNPIDYRLIKWADYVVMPALFTKVDYIVQTLREANSDIEFIMDLDQLYHELPDYHPSSKKLTPALKDTLLANCYRVDILTAPNSAILNYYGRLANGQTDDSELYLERYGNLLSNFTFEDFAPVVRNPGDRVRVGLTLDPSQAHDLQLIEGPMRALTEKYQQKLEIIIYGWGERTVYQNPVLKDLSITYERPVPFFDYHSRLNELGLDIGLLPFVSNAYNTAGKCLLRYLDFSAHLVPVVASPVPPLDRIITEGENGMLAASNDDWVSKVSSLIDNATLRRDIGSYAQKTAWEQHSYTPKAIQRLRSIFI